MIRTLIVDDEPLARANLCVLLDAEDDVEVVGECADGEAAAAAIDELDPDVVFLDVRMPKLDGIGLLDRLQSRPLVVLVTAHDDYAVRAFDEGAVDYLLKPFDDERFATTLARIKARIGEREPAGDGRPREHPSYPSRILVKGAGRTVVVDVSEIHWIGGAGNYVRLHLGERRLLHRATFAETLSQLDPNVFVRIHRSTIVNVSRVRELEPIAKGAWRVRLDDGPELRLSASYRQDLEDRLRGASVP